MSTEIVRAGGSLAIRPDQTSWTPEQQAVLQQSGISNDVTAAELSGFLHLCQRTQLDPFSRQIYLIGRKDKRAGRVVFTPQTGIDGYRVVAHRVVAASSENFGYEDTQWCDQSGRWRDVWLAKEPPAAARVTVVRNGHRFPAIALYREYVQTGWEDKPIGLWGKMPASQLAKCAEALALRRAFPHDLSGVYTAEEMAQADNPESAQQAVGGGQVRRLRPAEPTPDEWSTPVAATPAGREYLREALDAPDADTVRRIWQDAKAAGAVPEYLEQIAQVGRDKTAAATPSDPAADEPLDVEATDDPEETEHQAAVRELRAAAEEARLDNFENGAHQALGLPVEDAAPAAIRNLAAQIRSSIAA